MMKVDLSLWVILTLEIYAEYTYRVDILLPTSICCGLNTLRLRSNHSIANAKQDLGM